MEKGERFAVYNEFDLSKDKTKVEGENILVFLKQIYDPKSEKAYDWVFATNVEEVALSNIISTYKKRWRLETGFRVQDDATIKCKSTEMKIRYFLFAFQQMLQTQWVCFWKDEVRKTVLGKLVHQVFIVKASVKNDKGNVANVRRH